ncbi:dTMP kinase [Arthrobacter sp. V4I6]|uniref:thymidylate kinase n=1 Tax=unclassified Arthrobacter TaxID=235627 RepID=UPI002787F56D|nr:MULTISPECIES: thymidylate kinase [unclassified Arthrobacter]MDQ0821334.1 dTMP kinase [Arthrobacter sp. V1I7]MDQ0855598.1 dTMP kinase [Arthrobacter sp. V4I6]
MLIVLTGIDGSGKTTAARSAVAAARTAGKDALLLSNYAGRRRMSLLTARFGIRLPPRLADAVETVIRTANVLLSHAMAHRHPGLVIMDRHLYCQLALRQARQLPRGRVLPFILAKLPKPDLVVHLVITPEQAHQRVLARGTDAETLEELDSFRAAYQAIPEYAQFTELAADGTPDEVLSELTLAIAGAGGDSDTKALAADGRAMVPS